MIKLDNLRANSIAGYTARYQTYEGREHVIVPVTILVEGVHHGSAGPIYYPANELQTFPDSWNGRPVTIGHPEQGGVPVSGNAPDITPEWRIGTLFNTVYDSDRRGLRAEAWIDITRARALCPEVLTCIANGTPIEVSTGLWFEDGSGPGNWNGEEFETTATSFRPDHLAFLPNTPGACSLTDGCGVRANKGGDAMAKDDKSFISILKDAFKKSETKEEKVEVLMEMFAVNKPGLLTTIRSLQRAVDAYDKETPQGFIVHYLEDAYDDGTFVMKMIHPVDGVSYYRGEYAVDNEGDVEVGSELTEVRERREFVEVANNGESNAANIQTQNTEEETEMEKAELVKTLIDCDRTHFTENHREALMDMEMATLEALQPEQEQPEGNAEGEVDTGETTEGVAAAQTGELDAGETGEEENTEGTAGDGGDDQGTEEPDALEKYLEDAPEELKGQLQSAVKTMQEHKTSIVKAIMEHPRNKFTKENLEVKELDELEALQALLPDVPDAVNNEVGREGTDPMSRPTIVNFAGRSGPQGNTDSGESAPMGRPAISSLTAKKQ